MGIHLSLILTDKDSSKDFRDTSVYKETMRIRLDQDYIFFDLFGGFSGQAETLANTIMFPGGTVLEMFGGDEDDEVVTILKDELGNRLHYFLAGDFHQIIELPEPISPNNMAVISFLKELKEDVPVVLYWY